MHRPAAVTRSPDGEVFSMQFSQGDTLAILASITFVDTQETANADIEALRGREPRSASSVHSLNSTEGQADRRRLA